MKVIKPMKVAVLNRVVEHAGQPHFHIAAMLGFPLASSRALFDELAFWAAVGAALGSSGVIDDGFAKARGEVLVAGSFHAPGGAPLPASYVRVKLGSLDKRLAVIGNRCWRDGVPTEPEPISTLPIDWSHAFGGAGFARNPYGKGFGPIEVEGRLTHLLPNVERHGALLRSTSEHPEPSGFLPMDVSFAQRRSRAGTYDQKWFEEHFPGLPADAAPTFFNTAPEDQWIDGFFRGDESFLVENMHPDAPKIEGRLPGLVARCFVTHRTSDGERFIEIPLRWDTVWLFPSTGAGVVIAHGTLPVSEDDAADVVHLLCACEDPATPRPVEHYRATLARRLDKDKGAIAGLSDSDLMPPRGSGVALNMGETDIGRWVKSEDLHARNMRRGEERRRAELRVQIEAEGLDPKDYLEDQPPEPEVPPMDDPDALEAYVETQLARLDELRADLEAKQAAAVEQARKTAAEMGEDYDAMMDQASKHGMGPPKPPLDDPELADLDPELRAQLQRQHKDLVEMYQRLGHLQSTAVAMDAEASDRARIVVALARDLGESLAGRDFTGANLAGMKLAGVDFSGAFLEAADLAGCDLSGADLSRAVLAKADLRGADLSGAKLHGANFGGARLGDAVLDNADLTDAVLSRVDVSCARLAGARLTGVDWLESKLGSADLSGAVLGPCNLFNTDLRGARLSGADLSEANLIDCQLDGADLSKTRLAKTTFVRCSGRDVSFRGAHFQHGVMVHGSSFPRADFRDADMEHATVRGTTLVGARFDGSNLASADLSECDVNGASFDRAVMTSCLLIRTNLDGASLRGANLMDALASKAKLPAADFTGANLYRADMSRALSDARTTFAEAELGRVRVLPKAIIRGAS